MWLSLLFIVLSCDSITQIGQLADYFLRIKIIGSYDTAASSVTGGVEPSSVDVTLKDLKLTVSGSSEESVLEEKDVLYTVINRPQILYKKQFTDSDVGAVYSRLEVTIDSSIKIVTKYNSSGETKTLASGTTLVYDKGFTVSKGEDILFLVKVKWKSTVERNESTQTDSIKIPDMELVLDEATTST